MPENNEQPDNESAVVDGDESGPDPIVAFGRRLLRCYCWTLILGTLYVLSVGPMHSAWYKAKYMGEGSRFVLLFYTPLAWACQTFKPIDDWVAGYLEWWV